MTTVQRSLVLAAAMLLTALAAIFDIIPAAFAEYAPLGLLVFLPWAISGERQCSLRKSEES